MRVDFCLLNLTFFPFPPLASRWPLGDSGTLGRKRVKNAATVACVVGQAKIEGAGGGYRVQEIQASFTPIARLI